MTKKKSEDDQTAGWMDVINNMKGGGRPTLKVWLLSYGFPEEGWYPIGVFSSEENALEKAAQEVMRRVLSYEKLKPLQEEIARKHNLGEKLTDREIVERHNDLNQFNILLCEQTEIDKDMRE